MEKYESSLINNLLGKIPEQQYDLVKFKMKVALQMEKILTRKNMTKKEFAIQIGKNPSEITKWLSGTHNFTIETLWEISNVLKVSISELIGEEQNNKPKVIYSFTLESQSPISINSNPSFMSLKAEKLGNNLKIEVPIN
ncbi:MAG TPA: helix-turn-helix transcriptional regulator [Cytophagaceae bacterium]|jgi:transcriptional regulator with XRE-family HTH domain|nr:helix-turn-helix transcriptional regulator [Cytophagaceae bacterium]